MKQSDIFSIIIVATVGTLFSYFLVNSFLGNPDELQATIKTIQEISPTITSPDPELFNPAAINPTVEVYIGGCVDANNNGIIDPDERRVCDGGGSGDSDDDNENVFVCPDGTAVGNQSLCNENGLDVEAVYRICDTDHDGALSSDETDACGIKM